MQISRRGAAGVAAVLLALAACGGDPASEEARRAADSRDAGPALDIELPTGAARWQVDGDRSSVSFQGSMNGNPFDGGFSRFEIGVLLDPDAPDQEGAIEARIDLASVDAGDSEKNDALPTPTWFDIAAHPVATYRADRIRRTGPGAYEAEGTLTLKGVTRDVTLPFTLAIDETGRAIADGQVTLNRSEFSVGTGEFAEGKWVAFEVEVILHVEAEPAA